MCVEGLQQLNALSLLAKNDDKFTTEQLRFILISCWRKRQQL